MIPYIKSLSELMAITESRELAKDISKNNESQNSKIDNWQIKRYIRSEDKKGVNLPNIPKTLRRKWIQNKDTFSRFIDDLDYNNQIQSSYDLTLLERQNKIHQQDVA